MPILRHLRYLHVYKVNEKLHNVTPHKVYSIINNISNYENYIPYCQESIVSERDPQNGLPRHASLRIKFNQYDETFVCLVKCQELVKDEKFTVLANTISNDLFNCFICEWDITKVKRLHRNKKLLSDVPMTNLQLIIKFKFKSRFYNLLSTIFGERLTKIAMKGFCRQILKQG